MSYIGRDMSVLAYANGFTLWQYRTADGPTEPLQHDYFRAAADMLRRGDVIYVTTDFDPPTRQLVVLSVGDEGVRVAPLS